MISTGKRLRRICMSGQVIDQVSGQVIDQVVLELNSLMAVGINDLRECSFLHSGCESVLLLKELLKASTLRCRGWEELFMIDVILANSFLSPTTSMGSSGQSRTELAFLTSSFSFCPCLCCYLPSRPLHEGALMPPQMFEVMSSAPQKYLRHWLLTKQSLTVITVEILTLVLQTWTLICNINVQ